MRQRLHRLSVKFRQQEEFSTGYSPLYARLFGAVAGWLEEPGAGRDPSVSWLVDAGRERRSLEVTLLLAAALHRDVLAMKPGVSSLAPYFHTVTEEPVADLAGFETALREAVLARQESLAAFVRNGKVQTNETGRGLCWLLPLMATGWEAVHLVDLGASAGLNLVAEKRAYRLVDGRSEGLLLDVGQAPPVQFVTRCQGELQSLQNIRPDRPIQIASRGGCDLAPFVLSTAEDELTLMSFVWGDQPGRLQRLREGIAALKRVQKTEAPVSLFPVELPAGLDEFLRESVPADPALPVAIYNTYMTTYLSDRGRSLPERIGRWAATQRRPVLWVQWEVSHDGRQEDRDYLCVWTADLWQNGEHGRWLLGWVHPHGGEASFTPGLRQWIELWPVG